MKKIAFILILILAVKLNPFIPAIYLSANGNQWVKYTSYQKMCAVESVYENMAQKYVGFAKSYYAGDLDLGHGAAALDFWYGQLKTSIPFESPEEKEFIFSVPLTKVIKDMFSHENW